jgi:magnesium transporter
MMWNIRRGRYSPGAPPGSLLSEEIAQKPTKITMISYSPDDYDEKEAESIEECFHQLGKRPVTWINVEGTQDPELLGKLGEIFNFHPLALEDVINGGQRPKVEDFSEYLFVILNVPRKSDTKSPVNINQINIFIGNNFVITMHDSEDVFEPLIRRMKENKGRIRKMGADYLAYAIIDLLADQYFPVMESIGDQIESVDEEMQEETSPELVKSIRRIKRDLIFIRSSIWPMREVVNSLQREDVELISETVDVFLRDVYDHTIQIADIVESYRDILSEMFNVYLSITANNTNEIMKVLTIFASIFIPLTFVAGIYGMNFEYMPELKWRPGYFILLGLMVVISGAMLRFFRRRGWL